MRTEENENKTAKSSSTIAGSQQKNSKIVASRNNSTGTLFMI